MMDSFELNKLIGAFLAVVFVVFSVSIVSNSIFATHAPENPGYIIEAAEEGASGGGQAAEEGPSIAELLQTADPAAGENAFKKCAACHTTEEGGANKVGPNLWNIINRPVASHEGFNYSAGMREFSQGGSVVWDYTHISEFLKSPRNYVSGTAMAFAGLKNPQEEANLIAYLRTLSADPAPLPEVAAAPAESEEAAPAEADEAAPAEDNAQPAEEAAPQPDTTDDGSSASPETDAGEGAGSEAQPEETAPADQ